MIHGYEINWTKLNTVNVYVKAIQKSSECAEFQDAK
jgi:hypothetical protein